MNPSFNFNDLDAFLFYTTSKEDKFIWMFIESKSSVPVMTIQHPNY